MAKGGAQDAQFLPDRPRRGFPAPNIAVHHVLTYGVCRGLAHGVDNVAGLQGHDVFADGLGRGQIAFNRAFYRQPSCFSPLDGADKVASFGVRSRHVSRAQRSSVSDAFVVPFKDEPAPVSGNPLPLHSYRSTSDQAMRIKAPTRKDCKAPDFTSRRTTSGWQSQRADKVLMV
jgi:hypothetical protein